MPAWLVLQRDEFLCLHDPDTDVFHVEDVCPVDLLRLCAGCIVYEDHRVVVCDSVKDRGADAVRCLDPGDDKSLIPRVRA